MGPERTAFDVWLSQALRAGRDAVMAEPMPDEWLRLVLGSPRAAGDPDPDRRAGPGPGPCAAAPPRLRSAGAWARRAVPDPDAGDGVGCAGPARARR